MLSWSAYFFKPESVAVSAEPMIGKATIYRIIIGAGGLLLAVSKYLERGEGGSPDSERR
jgi:hypothetical protein